MKSVTILILQLIGLIVILELLLFGLVAGFSILLAFQIIGVIIIVELLFILTIGLSNLFLKYAVYRKEE